MRRLTVAALLAAALGLAACGSTHSAANRSSTSSPAASSTKTSGSGSSGTSATSSTSGTSATSGTSSTASTSGTSGTSGTSSTSTPGGECATSQLAASLTNPSGAAGSVYYHLVITNKGSSTCFVAGYPGVSFVTTPDGSPIGAPAKRQANPNGAPAQKVTLASGASAYSVLQIVEAGNFPDSACGMTKVPGLRIYPPNQKTSLYVTSQQEACSDSSTVIMNVEPLQAAS
jgi:hypothetical protein